VSAPPDPQRNPLRDKLRRVLPAPSVPRAPRADVDPPAGLVEFGNEHGAYLARTTRFDAAHRHGELALAAIDHARAADLALVARDPALAALDPRSGLFLDIETNGLQGGAGGIAFLVALGEFRPLEGGGRSFELWQGFLRSPADERALLADVERRIREAPLVVTFFGKSFDRHRLEDKLRYHALPTPFADKPHLDLYWPCRRLYGAGLPNGRLATMERELLGVERTDDLPGSLAPAAWLDFLAGRAHRLEQVFAHNRDDLLSLVGLVAHVGRASDGTHADGTPLRGDAELRARSLEALRAKPRRR
jgi:uncharacterized protein YprB with RNaseH-like and TPR domain